MVADYCYPLPWFVLLPLFVISMALMLYAAVRYAIVPQLAQDRDRARGDNH